MTGERGALPPMAAPDNEGDDRNQAAPRVPMAPSTPRADDRATREALRHFLSLIDWSQGTRRILEALPHIDAISTVATLRSMLHRLGFQTTYETVSPARVRADYLPCLLHRPDDSIEVVEAVTPQGRVRVFRPGEAHAREVDVESLSGWLIFAEDMRNRAAPRPPSMRWSYRLLDAMRPLIARIFALSFVTNVLALAGPLFVMAVYDKAIGAEAYDVLAGLAVGVALVVAADFTLREVRGRLQAYLGARVDNLVSQAALTHLLHLPLALTENAPVGSQITRLRQMTSLREAFTGPLAAALFDLPFLLLFLLVISVIGGPIVIAPAVLAVCYVVLGAWAVPYTHRLVREAGEKSAELQNLVVEALSSQAAIHDLHAEDVWERRHRKLSAQMCQTSMKARRLNNLLQTLSSAMVSVTGVAVIAMGVGLVLTGDITAGALIAVMALSWRVLTPLRNIFVCSLTLSQTIQALGQVDRLVQLPLERDPMATPSIQRQFRGDITFEQVSFRYPNQRDPALRSVSFSAKAGEMVCLIGPSGAGKTTVLKLLMGLYQQQGGAIYSDGVDLRQLAVDEWRHSYSAALNETDLFFGTLSQNLRLAEPGASEQDMHAILTRFGVHEYFGGALDQGLDTKITAETLGAWPDSLKKRIGLARTFIRRVPVYLLDNTSADLDAEGESALLSIIEERRAEATFIMATHRPSHMRRADTLIWLDRGALRSGGAPAEVVPQLMAS